MTYAVEILRSAQKQLANLDQQAQGHLIDSIRALADNP
jgi:mRNA-degrading endonuclease RelE of RelBE toxin-antitoxin system